MSLWWVVNEVYFLSFFVWEEKGVNHTALSMFEWCSSKLVGWSNWQEIGDILGMAKQYICWLRMLVTAWTGHRLSGVVDVHFLLYRLEISLFPPRKLHGSDLGVIWDGGQILKLYSVVPPPHLEKKSRHLVGSFLGNDSIAVTFFVLFSFLSFGRKAYDG